jgi:hypothetical protein
MTALRQPRRKISGFTIPPTPSGVDFLRYMRRRKLMLGVFPGETSGTRVCAQNVSAR